MGPTTTHCSCGRTLTRTAGTDWKWIHHNGTWACQ